MTTPDLPVFPAPAWLIRAATAAGMDAAEVRRLSSDGRALSVAMGRLPKPERAGPEEDVYQQMERLSRGGK